MQVGASFGVGDHLFDFTDLIDAKLPFDQEVGDECGGSSFEERVGEFPHHGASHFWLGDFSAIHELSSRRAVAYDPSFFESSEEGSDGGLCEAAFGEESILDVNDRRLSAGPEEPDDGELEVGEMHGDQHGSSLANTVRRRLDTRNRTTVSLPGFLGCDASRQGVTTGAKCAMKRFEVRENDDGRLIRWLYGLDMPKLMTQVRAASRERHYSARTERAYCAWVVRYVRHCNLRHPLECGDAEVRAFLEYVSGELGLGASTHRQVRAALLFLYRDVLCRPLADLRGVAVSRRASRVPHVIEPTDVERVLAHMSGIPRLVVMLMYGAGLRLNEALSLRIRDVDLSRHTLMVRADKGTRNRRVMLPETMRPLVRDQVSVVRLWHARAQRLGGGYLPSDAYPHTVRDWRWAWLFPSARDVYDRGAKRRVRYHTHASTIQRAIALVVGKAGISERVTAYTFRHSFATQLLRSGSDVHTVQRLLGHSDVSTTAVYLGVLERGVVIRSPLDRLRGLFPK